MSDIAIDEEVYRRIVKERDAMLNLARRLAEALDGALGLIARDEDEKALLKEAEEMLWEKP
jgi:hypothetical protein